MANVLILHTSIGLGHKSIAQNIAHALQREGFYVKVEDILQVESGWVVHAGTWLHRIVNRFFPWLWTWLYASTDHGILAKLTLPLRVMLAAKNSSQALKLIREFQPDLIITTQTSASAVVAYLKRTGAYKGKFAIAFSDYHLHTYWLYEEADFYLANTQEQKQEMAEHGIDPERVNVCGMTLEPQHVVDTERVRQDLNILPAGKIILVASGSLGTGLDFCLIERLSAHSEWYVIIVCGKNKKLHEILRQKFALPNVRVLGFFKPMQNLYAIADIFLTKPGGLTMAEALSFRLPIVLTHYLPGQELLNTRYLLARHLVLDGLQGSVEDLVKIELISGSFRKELKVNSTLPELIDFGQKVQTVVRKYMPKISS